MENKYKKSDGTFYEPKEGYIWLDTSSGEFYIHQDNKYLKFIDQPERSKREDLGCYDFQTLQMCYKAFHNDYCAHDIEIHNSTISHICNRLEESIKQHKMRCSEHCGKRSEG